MSDITKPLDPSLVVAPAHYDRTACWDWIDRELEVIHLLLLQGRLIPDRLVFGVPSTGYPGPYAPILWNLGTAMRYLWRAGVKPGNPAEQDIARARQYIARVLAPGHHDQIDTVIAKIQESANDEKRRIQGGD